MVLLHVMGIYSNAETKLTLILSLGIHPIPTSLLLGLLALPIMKLKMKRFQH